MQNFLSLVNQNSSKSTEASSTWDNKNEIIPDGWKIQACPTNSRKHFVIAPTGIKFDSIRQSLS